MPAKSMPMSRPGERRVGTELVVAGGIVVDVMHAEQERVDRRPLEAERSDFEDGIIHAARLGPQG